MHIPILPVFYLCIIINIVDEKRVLITDHIGAVTISPATAEKLQRKQPIIRKDSPKRDSNKPTDSKVQSMKVHQDVWAPALKRAEEIAEDAIRSQAKDPNAKLSPEAWAKVRSMAAKLIVTHSSSCVSVENNVDKAEQVSEALKHATKTKNPDLTPE